MNPVWNWIYADVRHGVLLYWDGVDLGAMPLEDSPPFISSRLFSGPILLGKFSPTGLQNLKKYTSTIKPGRL